MRHEKILDRDGHLRSDPNLAAECGHHPFHRLSDIGRLGQDFGELPPVYRRATPDRGLVERAQQGLERVGCSPAQALRTPSTFSGLERQMAALTVAIWPWPSVTAAVFQGSPTQ